MPTEELDETLDDPTKLYQLKQTRTLQRTNNTKLCNDALKIEKEETNVNNIISWHHSIQQNFASLKHIEDQITTICQNLQLEYNQNDLETYNKYVVQTKDTLDSLTKKLQLLLLNKVDKDLDTTQNLDNTIQNSNNSLNEATVSTTRMEQLLEKFLELQNPSSVEPIKVPPPEFDPDSNQSFQNFKYDLEQYFKHHAKKINSDSKPYYLRKQVKGKAHEMLQNVSRELPYEDLIALLESAYSNEIKEKYDSIKDLITLEYKNSVDYFAELTVIENTISVNEMSIKDFQRYFAWNCLPIPIRNNIKALAGSQDPTYKDITDNIFHAERLTKEQNEPRQKQNKNYNLRSSGRYNSNKNKSVAAATNIQRQTPTNINKFKGKPQVSRKGPNAFKPGHNNRNSLGGKSEYISSGSPSNPYCSLCRHNGDNDKHLFSKCSIYKDLDARIKRLKEIGACLICTYYHDTKNCYFKDIKCGKCNLNHTLSLCTKKEEPKEGSIYRSANIALCSQGLQPHSTLLPSLSANINNHTVHLLLDSGAQSNFISEKIVKEHNLKVIKDNIPLTVSGVNSKREYNIKEVKVSINIAGRLHQIDCFTLPQIDLSIKVPKVHELINIVQSFNCELADRSLFHVQDNQIAKYDLILGISDLSKLRLKPVYLGDTCLWQINNLTILHGNVDEMIADLNAFKHSVFCNE